MGALDPTAVEASLTAYYDDEGDDRLHQPIEPRRLAMRGSFLESLSERRRHILEIGAGPGRDAAAFIAAGHHFFAMDLSMEHARRCRSTGARVVRATVRRLPFRQASFDSLWTMSTLMHVPDSAIGSALAEVSRVLKPGGAAAIGVWGGPDVEDYREEDLEKGRTARLFSRRSDHRWREMLAEIGTVEFFETWGSNDDFLYQFAVVRREE